MIEWVIDEDSIIRRIGYDREIKSMYIDFKNSEVDVPFCNVPEEVYIKFVESKSRVRFYLRYIRDFYDCYLDEKTKVIKSNVSETLTKI